METQAAFCSQFPLSWGTLTWEHVSYRSGCPVQLGLTYAWFMNEPRSWGTTCDLGTRGQSLNLQDPS
jgi:hypothetical protein